MSIPTESPWGGINQKTTLIPQMIEVVQTASHGGVYVTPTWNKLIPLFMKTNYYNHEGWYEEDCEYSVALIGLEKQIKEKGYEHVLIETKAKKTLRNWYPDIYEKYYNEIIPKGHSIIKDDEFFSKHAEQEATCK